MKIFILSTGRSEIDDSYTTLRNLPESVRNRVTLVVGVGETKSYTAIARKYGVKKILEAPKGVAKTRAFIVEKFPGRVCMMDDDIRFYLRREDDTSKFVNAAEEDVEEALDAIEQSLTGIWGVVSLCPREGGNRQPEDEQNTRLLRLLAYDTKKLKGVIHDRVQFMEDFDVQLQCLRKGVPTLCLANWAQGQRGSNTRGGCSLTRTAERQAKAAKDLAKLHPEFVRVVEKTTNHAWGGGTRIDVVIAWKKAFASSVT